MKLTRMTALVAPWVSPLGRDRWGIWRDMMGWLRGIEEQDGLRWPNQTQKWGSSQRMDGRSKREKEAGGSWCWV